LESSIFAHTLVGFLFGNTALKTLKNAVKINAENGCGVLFK